MKQDKTIFGITGAIAGFGLGILASYVLLKKKKHKKVHVLTVTLTFSSKSDKEAYKKYWAPLAEKVEMSEKNCLSYEWLDSTENETQAMIFERYVTKKDLDEEHAANLKEFKKNITTPPPKTLSVEFTHYEESNTGYMGK